MVRPETSMLSEFMLPCGESMGAVEMISASGGMAVVGARRLYVADAHPVRGERRLP